MPNIGLIQTFDPTRGTGTILPEEGGSLLLFSRSELVDPHRAPRPDQRYLYDVSALSSGQRRAVNLRREGREGHPGATPVHR
ncbi:hypothetical protein [Sphingomicrobium aestuariivivum]|uniref:hypothetical protein n=1 Tax=Sphingomicrobium aestuariivivum TaxID=1582356 RepID=UPI001FD70320|nr:hypothetical protein [Sphingomicrobium aestuariivivum]MCJ8191069.1 hypothetical protein [Sphingomicrobium aestuariivivum]